MATIKPKKRAASASPAKAPAKPRAKPTAGKRKPSIDGGPLTLDQARAIVAAKAAPARTSTKSKTARKAAARPGATKAAATETTLAKVAIERRKLAIQSRKERRQRIRDHKATLTLLQSRGVKGLPQPAAGTKSGRPAAALKKAGGAGPLRIFAEGDSWFDYPVPFFGGGIVRRLEDRLGVPILNMAKAGDETRFMLGVEQRQLIEEQLRDGCPDGEPWELMLFSGGGNDVVAQPLALWIHPFDAGLPPAKLLNQARYTNLLAMVRAAYEDLIELRNRLSQQTHLVFHGYDFAIPDGRGICGIGPWMRPAFDLFGYPADLAASTAVVHQMLTQFGAMLDTLATQPGVSVVKTQGTLTPVPASWHNEMHPSKSGFNQFADLFQASIQALFPGRVLS